MSAYEVWRFVEKIGDDNFVGPRYQWMVWRVGPITGAEEWFETEDEAHAYIKTQTQEDAA